MHNHKYNNYKHKIRCWYTRKIEQCQSVPFWVNHLYCYEILVPTVILLGTFLQSFTIIPIKCKTVYCISCWTASRALVIHVKLLKRCRLDGVSSCNWLRRDGTWHAPARTWLLQRQLSWQPAQTDGIVSDAVAAIIICRPTSPSEVNETRADNSANCSNAAHGLRLHWQLIRLSERGRVTTA